MTEDATRAAVRETLDTMSTQRRWGGLALAAWVGMALAAWVGMPEASSPPLSRRSPLPRWLLAVLAAAAIAVPETSVAEVFMGSTATAQGQFRLSGSFGPKEVDTT